MNRYKKLRYFKIMKLVHAHSKDLYNLIDIYISNNLDENKIII